MKEDKTSIGITQTFSQSILKKLIALAKKRGGSVQDLVRNFVADGLEKLENN